MDLKPKIHFFIVKKVNRNCDRKSPSLNGGATESP